MIYFKCIMAIFICLLITIDRSSIQARKSNRKYLADSSKRFVSLNNFNSFLSNDLYSNSNEISDKSFISSNPYSIKQKSSNRSSSLLRRKLKKKLKNRKRLRKNRRLKLYSQSSARPQKKWSLRALNSKRFTCGENECYPSIGDLLLGRKKYLYASSTCGVEQPTRYCKIGLTSSYKPGPIPFLPRKTGDFSCDVCDSSEPYNMNNPVSHLIENVVFDQPVQYDSPKKWWQSENGRHRVFIQFDLEAEFTMTHIIMRFETYPPEAMIMEKSSDFGRTWHTIAYYARNCREHFPKISTQWSYDISEPICISRYNTHQYSTGSELLYRPLSRFFVDRNNPTIESIKNKSDILENKLKITNLRINFTRLQMHGDQNLPSSGEDSSLIYYYAVSELRVFGSCFCNGHGVKCLPISKDLQYDYHALGRMVGGRCDCEHNTMGPNCEQCKPLYNDRQWTYGKKCVKCECFEHANSCYFNETVFMKNNGISGGVCIGCMHNTEGNNCERCKVNFYRDPNLPPTHHESCKPCKCNHIGSMSSYVTIDGGYACSTQNCVCKKNVEGETCNRCKDGFWNLSLQNPDGCQECPCKREGTVGNRGCNFLTGECYKCKSNVIGEKCDTCATGYYGLSLDEEGCKPCECSVYGSYPVPCDRETGQCVCRPHTTGRQCETIQDGFFCPSLDYLTYEAEFTTSNKSIIHERVDLEELDKATWSGIGYLRVYDGSVIKFSLDHMHATGFYSILMRYDDYHANDFDEVKTKVTDLGLSLSQKSLEKKNRLAPVYNCAKLGGKVIREKSVYLDKRARSKIMFDNYCFQQYHSYVIELFFKSPYNSKNYIMLQDAPTILIDSIVLVPNVDYATIFKEANGEIVRSNFFNYGCDRSFHDLPKYSIDEHCQAHTCAITADYFGVLPCSCDPTGSASTDCDKFNGQCRCKHNVINRICDMCNLGSWGFGLESLGCKACSCDPVGAMSFNCNKKTGYCSCYEGKTGQQCDKCLDGYYSFPDCRKCECNGLSKTCDLQDGTCNDCQLNTEGRNCERCKIGYFGDPLADKECKMCQCPNINGNTFAYNNSCSYDRINNSVKCNCMPGYTGNRCDKCEVGYYGNPLEKGGSCKKCNCNNNTNINNQNDCDPKTGVCKTCLYNTYGDRCERCKPGYFGNALLRTCKPCKCDPYGTEGNSKSNCDHETGICKCLPKVTGMKCNECAGDDHWNLRSGKGCSICDCDTTGTTQNSTSCNELTGKCECLSDRGGRRCNDCQSGYYGSPRTECKSCNCNLKGSVTNECDKHTGQCKCIRGVVGKHCEKCARGHVGEFPNCRPCGECFEGWDRSIKRLDDEFTRMEFKAIEAHSRLSPIKTNFTEFNLEYDKILDNFDDIYKILERQSKPDKRLFRIKNNITQIEQEIKRIRVIREKFNHTAAKFDMKPNLMNTQKEIKSLDNNVTQLLETAFNLRESFINGAKYTIENAFELSDQSHKTLNKMTKESADRLDELINKLEELNKDKLDQLAKEDEKENENSKTLKPKVIDLNTKLSKLNSLVCGGPIKSDCKRNKCGAVGCNRCGLFDESIPIEDQECLSGTESLLMYHDHLVKVFNETYEAKESEFKKTLNKFYTRRLHDKKTLEDLSDLNKTVTKFISKVNSTRDSINKLSIESDELGDKYKSNEAKIKENLNVVKEAKLELDEEDLDRNLEKMASMSKSMKTRVVEIEKETQEPLKDAESLKKLADHHEKLLEKDLGTSLEDFHKKLDNLNLISYNLSQELQSTTDTNQLIIDLNHQTNQSIISIQNKFDELTKFFAEAYKSNEPNLKILETEKNSSAETLLDMIAKSEKYLEDSKDIISLIEDNFDILNNQMNRTNGRETLEIFDDLIELQKKVIEKSQSLKKRKEQLEAKRYERQDILDRIKQMELVLKDLKMEAESSREIIEMRRKACS